MVSQINLRTHETLKNKETLIADNFRHADDFHPKQPKTTFIYWDTLLYGYMLTNMVASLDGLSVLRVHV